MPLGVVVGLPGVPGVNGVTGQDARRSLDHVLGVARGTPDGVEFQEFSALILVGRILGGLVVAQIEQHRWMQTGRRQELVESPESVLAQQPVVVAAPGPSGVVDRGDVQVIGPEVGHHFVQLAGRVGPTKQGPVRQVDGVVPLALAAGEHVGPLVLSAFEPVGIPGVVLAALGVADLRRAKLILEPLVGAAGATHRHVRAAVVTPGEAVHHQSGSRGRDLGGAVGPDLRRAQGCEPGLRRPGPAGPRGARLPGDPARSALRAWVAAGAPARTHTRRWSWPLIVAERTQGVKRKAGKLIRSSSGTQAFIPKDPQSSISSSPLIARSRRSARAVRSALSSGLSTSVSTMLDSRITLRNISQPSSVS